MRASRLTLLVTLSLSIAAARTAHAQFGVGGKPGAKSMVVMMPDVQKELKLSGDQKKQIMIAQRDLMNGGGMSMNMSTMNEEMDAKVLGGLNADQLSRLTELWIQYEGPLVLQDKVVAESVKLTDDQKTQIKAIWDKYQDTVLESMRNMRSNSAMNALKKTKKEADAATLALLTPDQIKAFTDMQGKAFKFQMKKEI